MSQRDPNLSQSPIIQTSHFYQLNEHSLHVRQICIDDEQSDRIPVLMLHGSIENGRIFYTNKNKGLGGFLAQQGYDVYVADYRGRGASKPSVEDKNDHGYSDVIIEDIPFLIKTITEKTGQPCHVICHSWGGVMFASAFVRFPKIREHVRSAIKFGTKRQITVHNMERWFKVDMFWRWFAPVFTKRSGYLDAKKMGVGADSEPRQAIMESISWVTRGPWIDPIDHFNYGEAAKGVTWPPTWHMTGIKDLSMGHAQDVQLFIEECKNNDARFDVLSIQKGNARDYDHIDILTAPEAVTDHFPLVSQWLAKH
jgi:predicted alpha/beta hydrolase